MKNKAKTIKYISVFLCLFSFIISATTSYFAVVMYSGKNKTVPLVLSVVYSVVMFIMIVKEKMRSYDPEYNILLGAASLGMLVFPVIYALYVYDFFGVSLEPASGAVIIISAVFFVNAVVPLFKTRAFSKVNKTAKLIGTIISVLCNIIVAVNGTWSSIALCLSILLIYIADWLYMTNE